MVAPGLGRYPQPSPDRRRVSNDATWFREKLAELGHTQSSFAREMSALGDPRPVSVILRGISRIATGSVAVPGEMRVVLSLLATRQPSSQWRNDPAA